MNFRQYLREQEDDPRTVFKKTIEAVDAEIRNIDRAVKSLKEKHARDPENWGIIGDTHRLYGALVEARNTVY